MLSRLVAGHSDVASSEQSELGGLVRPEAKHMSLPQALNALRRGEIDYPHDDGSLTGLVSGVSAIPTTRPSKQVDVSPEFEAQRRQDQLDRAEMRERIIAKRYSASATAMKRLDEAERQLLGAK